MDREIECLLCKSIVINLGKHLNLRHKKNLTYYFDKFPDQKSIYALSKRPSWCKGKTKYTDPTVSKIAQKMKVFSNQDAIKEQRSKRLKERYKYGDILSPEQRKKAVEAGSKAWVNKFFSFSKDERDKIISNLSKKGNESQAFKRHLHTPEDFMRLYPWSKGTACWYPCDFCKKNFIAWFGGKDRAKKRFCNAECWKKYRVEHHNYTFPKRFRYYSKVSNLEFILASNLEKAFAQLLDENNIKWTTPNFYINYFFEGKKLKYYPDFFVDGKTLIELKSNYTYNYQKLKNEAKFKSAVDYCQKNGYKFYYWIINTNRPTAEKIKNDQRIIEYLLGRNRIS